MANPLYVERAASYFAVVQAFPARVDQAVLVDLQQAFEAQDSPDFVLASYPNPYNAPWRTSRLHRLPFRLSMGLHESLPQPGQFDDEATAAVVTSYATAEIGHPDRTLTGWLAATQRVYEAATGALVDAALHGIPRDQVLSTLHEARKQRLLSRKHATYARRAVDTICQLAL
jgi:hypothetical protein